MTHQDSMNALKALHDATDRMFGDIPTGLRLQIREVTYAAHRSLKSAQDDREALNQFLTEIADVRDNMRLSDMIDMLRALMNSAKANIAELQRRDSVMWTEGMLDFIHRAVQCRTHIIEGYEGNPDLKALVDLGVFEVIGNDMYHLRNSGYGEQHA